MTDKWIAALFCLCLGGMLALFLLLPGRDYSPREKRVLASAPALRMTDVLSGRFGADAERYTADHLPFRDFLVGLNARFALWTGRQTDGGIYLCRDGRLVEAPVAADRQVIEDHLGLFHAFAAAAPCPVDLMLVPSAGYVLRDLLPALAVPYEDGAILSAARTAAGPELGYVDLLPAFQNAADPAALYYRTDHHWSSLGAWLACKTYLEALGRTALPRDAYEVETVPGFRGSTYSRAALWSTPAESLELWRSGGSFTVENADSPGPHQGLFYPERLAEDDKYPVFLDGNHSLVRIRNEQGSGRLLVIRDSFGNSLGCFLADSFQEVVLVDLRYYRGQVSELLAEEDFDRVLILYSVGNFMTDGNIGKLA